jgi:hypothetical protein
MKVPRPLERITVVTPAYDCIRVQPCKFGSDRCKPDTGGSHGIHNCELHITVRGATAEVTLVISTGWDLRTVPPRAHRRYPFGAYVEFHTSLPRFEGQEPTIRMELHDDATCKPWANCYLDRGYVMAEEPAEMLVEKGSDAVWTWLERQYDQVLCDMLKLDD